MKVETKVVRQYENADDEECCVMKVFSSIPRPIWAGFHIPIGQPQSPKGLASRLSIFGMTVQQKNKAARKKKQE